LLDAAEWDVAAEHIHEVVGVCCPAAIDQRDVSLGFSESELNLGDNGVS
jgi:hypothetical protein